MVRVRYSFGCRHTGRIENIKKQRGKYPEVMREVVRISDIVLEILDARFIEETRNLEVEKDVLDKGKILVYVFNKCDLIDVKEMEAQIPNWMRPYVFVSATKGAGLGALKARIKMESKRILTLRNKKEDKEKDKEKGEMSRDEKLVAKKKKDSKVVKDLESKKRIHVGVIGYPNAGKSSVINFITRKGVAKTGKQAGFTKGMQKIRMSEGILILDTPGVIPESRYSTESKSFARDVKVGGRTYSDVKDPEDIVYYLMSAPAPKDADNLTEDDLASIEEAKRNAGAIEEFYGVGASRDDGGQMTEDGKEREGEEVDVEAFIEELGRKRGFLGKGGVVDVDRTARIVLRDWQEGRIRI